MPVGCACKQGAHFVLQGLCLQKGWVSSIEDLEKPAKKVIIAAESLNIETASVAKKARINAAQLSKKCGNLFVAAAQQLNDSDQINGIPYKCNSWLPFQAVPNICDFG